MKQHRCIVLAAALLSSAVGWAALAAEAAGEQLTALVDEMWQFALREDPLFATRVGDRRYNDLLPTVSVADTTRRHDENQEFQQRLQAIDREVLMLRHFEQLPNNEIATILEISPSGATLRYLRALGRLQEILEQFRPQA